MLKNYVILSVFLLQVLIYISKSSSTHAIFAKKVRKHIFIAMSETNRIVLDLVWWRWRYNRLLLQCKLQMLLMHLYFSNEEKRISISAFPTEWDRQNSKFNMHILNLDFTSQIDHNSVLRIFTVQKPIIDGLLRFPLTLLHTKINCKQLNDT